jgi:hypothetical protein
MRYLGGHLGDSVSALLDGQLDDASAERAWAHVHACALCAQQVAREGWVKTRLAGITGPVPSAGQPPAELLGSLYGLGRSGGPSARARAAEEEQHAWAAVREVERQGRGRRVRLVAAGAGTVTAAALGLAGLGGATLGIGVSPHDAPTTAITGPGPNLTPGMTPGMTPGLTPGTTPVTTAVIAPSATVHGRLPRRGETGGPQAGTGLRQ